MSQKMMRRFDASAEYAKDMGGYLANIRPKYDTHAFSIKNLELQMAQLSTTMKLQQSGTLPRNTIQSHKNDGNFMTITTQRGKEIIDPPMLSVVEYEMRKDEEVVEASGELVDNAVKEVEVPQKVTSIPRPPIPFPQRLVKNTEDRKKRHLINIMKQLSMNVPLIEAL